VLCMMATAVSRMNLQELATIAAHRIPVKVFILNNGFLGMVGSGRTCSTEGHHMRPAWSARRNAIRPANRGQGMPGRQIPTVSEPESGVSGHRTCESPPRRSGKVSNGTGLRRPCVVDVWVERTEDVKPMIPPGGTLADMIHTLE